VTKISVLVVDDSVVIRRLVTSVLSEDPSIEVVGSAASGRLALAKIVQLRPDIVTLDVEMPDMDGLEALAEIRRTNPRLPVIMFSTVTERGAAATLDALTLGANDYVTKPTAVGSVNEAMESVRHQLLPKIKALVGRAAGARQIGAAVPGRTQPAPSRPSTRAARPTEPGPATPLPVAAPSAAPVVARRAGPPSRVELVAIGLSTGGPDALSELLPKLPANLPVPVVIVQHMPAVFTRLFAERLTAKCSVPVHEAAHGDLVLPGHVYIAPGDYHMTLVREGDTVRVATNQEPPDNWCRPSVNVLFRSVAAVYGGSTLAVVLTGMGQDGLRGCEQLRATGAQILAQDEATSVVWGMPGIVATTGLADRVLPLTEVAPEIIRLVAAGRPAVAKAAAVTAVR
jgi:two-component system chemotaxis response regulator CheB